MKQLAVTLVAAFFVRRKAGASVDRSLHVAVGRRFHVAALREAADVRRLRGRESRKPPPDRDNLADETADQATTHPRKKEFDAVDLNKDGKISPSEYYATTRAHERVASYRFNCTDTNLDRSLDIHEFAEAQSKPQDLERCFRMQIAYGMADQNQDGVVTMQELWTTVDTEGMEGREAFMIACSDGNGDGKISPSEFSRDIYGCVEDKSEAAFVEFTKHSNADTNKDGCADQAEMSVAANKLLGNDLLSDKPPSRSVQRLAQRMINCADHDLNMCIDKEEWAHMMDEPTPEMEYCIGTSFEQYDADVSFEIMDTNGDGKISKQEYYTWCSDMEIEVEHEEADALFNSADVNNDGFINEYEYTHAGENHEGDGPGHFFFLRVKGRHPLKRKQSLQSHWKGFAGSGHEGPRHKFFTRFARSMASNNTRSVMPEHDHRAKF